MPIPKFNRYSDIPVNHNYPIQNNPYQQTIPLDTNLTDVSPYSKLNFNQLPNVPSIGNTPIDPAVGTPQNPIDNNRYNNIPPIVNSSDNNLDSIMYKIAGIETNHGTIKDRANSNYSGAYQLGVNERTPILKQLGVTDKQYKDSRDLQEQVGKVWFKSLNDRLLRNGFEATPLNMWIAHNQGVEGLNQILHNKVSPKVLENIRNQAGMDKNSTVQDYVNYYSNIMSQ